MWKHVVNTLWVLAGLALAPAVLVFAPQLAGADRAEVVLSGSMSPKLHKGDLALIENVDATSRDLKVGDIIAYQPSGETGPTVLHRIVSAETTVSGKYYITQGDANNAPDPLPVADDQVVGTYHFHLPAYGFFVLAAGTKPGILVFIVLPSLFIALHEFRKIVRRDEPQRDTPPPPPPNP